MKIGREQGQKRELLSDLRFKFFPKPKNCCLYKISTKIPQNPNDKIKWAAVAEKAVGVVAC
uniref:Uncharacterized protein n=1 Tax=Solanum tuberosum TaxID=4113 RepID=M1ARV8_SOLTU